MPPVAYKRGALQRTSVVDLAEDLDQAAADPLVSGLFVSLDGFTASAVDFFELLHAGGLAVS